MSKVKEKPLRIIVDSNALFVPLQFKIDIFEELKRLLNRNFELVLISPVREELEKLAERGSPKTRKTASYVLKLAEEKCVYYRMDQSFKVADEAIIQLAKKWGCLVFTNDRELKRRLRNINVPVIYVRQKSRLEIDGV